MARIYQPLQKKDGPNAGRWDYTVGSDEEGWVHAAGYCHEFIEPIDDALVQWPEEERQKMYATRDKFHVDGHATAEEAVACYHQYVIDHRLRLYKQSQAEAKELHRCEICQEWTGNLADTNERRTYWLCDEHLKPEIVLDLLNR